MRFLVLLLSFFISVLAAQAQWALPANLAVNFAGNTVVFNRLILNFSLTVTENSKPLLRWQSAAGKETFYSIERSGNGVDYEVIGVIKGVGSADTFLAFTDDAPSRGKIYYRVKITTEKQVFVSEVVSAIISDDISCKFYPNPVDKMLIVRSDLPVDIQVTDTWGKSFILTRLEAGLRVLDVSGLPSGVYVITLQQKDSNKQVTERLVKK
jgi:Secretion system C-terminal sorting domain